VHSFTIAERTRAKTRIFQNPISVVNLIETYKEVLASVAMELKVLKEPL